MTRDEYLLLLAEAVRRGALDEENARWLLAQFDAGELRPEWLPMPTDAALELMRQPVDVEQGYGNEELAALLLLLAALGLREIQNLNQRMAQESRRAARDVLRARWERTVMQLADDLAATGNVAAWQQSMTTEIRRYYIGQMTGGLGRSLTPAEMLRLERILEGQAGYLTRFAGDVGAHLAMGDPLSRAYTAQRSRMYGGEAWSLWHRGNEVGEDRPGWVVEYVAVDDMGTCAPCSAAQGYYLPGAGPYPGEICDGGSNCRCERVLVYLPEMYRQLGGG